MDKEEVKDAEGDSPAANEDSVSPGAVAADNDATDDKEGVKDTDPPADNDDAVLPAVAADNDATDDFPTEGNEEAGAEVIAQPADGDDEEEDDDEPLVVVEGNQEAIANKNPSLFSGEVTAARPPLKNKLDTGKPLEDAHDWTAFDHMHAYAPVVCHIGREALYQGLYRGCWPNPEKTLDVRGPQSLLKLAFRRKAPQCPLLMWTTRTRHIWWRKKESNKLRRVLLPKSNQTPEKTLPGRKSSRSWKRKC